MAVFQAATEAARVLAMVAHAGRLANRLAIADRAVHDWYRFVLSFPPHLVRAYLAEFGLEPGQTLLDPFCGTGTTLVEGKKLGLGVVGFEANPMAHLAATVKTNWDIDPGTLMNGAVVCAEQARRVIGRTRAMRGLPTEASALLLKDSICPRPLHKALILAEVIESRLEGALKQPAQVALASTLVFSASNLHFGPEVGVRGRKQDADVVGDWFARVRTMSTDLPSLRRALGSGTTRLYRHDAREVPTELEPKSVDAVFTSPPYPNEKDYTRTTRLESVVLGLIRNKAELQTFKKQLVRSNTRSIYSEDDDARWVAGNERIEAICREIEARRVALGKTSGFERMYHRVTRQYFGGMARQLGSLRQVLKPGAMLGYVVGDQASYLQVMIRTGEILAELAEGLGYEVRRIDLFRERFATATRANMREEVLVLRWPEARSG
jgi:DNA modification methylase